MKGIVLAGGTGSRLFPNTVAASKQLLPVYSKPMIYYPLSTLMLAGVREILVICNPGDGPLFERLLGRGEDWGISIQYRVQDKPNGIAEALVIGRPFLNGESVVLILGDNIFHGPTLGTSLARNLSPVGAHILATEVADATPYAVLELDKEGRPISLEEKPSTPRSSLAVTGLYFYAADAPDMVSQLRPSTRGELEITDLNRLYLDEGRLTYEVLPRGIAWMDAGTHDALHDAASYVRVIEERQGTIVACPEEVAWRHSWIDSEQLSQLAQRHPDGPYANYLKSLVRR